MDPNREPALSLSNSRLVRVYRDTQRPGHPARGGGSKSNHAGSLTRTQAGDNVINNAGQSQHPREQGTCGARKVHIEISDTAPIKQTSHWEEIAFDEAECWSESEEDEGNIDIEISPPPAQTENQTVPYAENDWSSNLSETFDNTITRSSSIVFNIDNNYFAEDSEDEFKEVPKETEISKKRRKKKKKKIPFHLFD